MSEARHSPSLRRLRSIFRWVRLRIRTAPAAPLNTPLDAAILNGAVDVVEFLLANGALVDERALIKSARHAPVFQRMLMLPCDHCCADFDAVVALSHGAQPDLSDESLARRVVDASYDERNFLLLLGGVKAAVRFSRPTCLAAAVACGVPVGGELLAFIQTPQTRARSTLRSVAWACESSSRAPPRSALRCRAAACQRYRRCSSSTRRVHHQALSFDCSAVWHSTPKPQRCSLSSSPLASLSSRHNSNWRSTQRSWISTTLLVRTDK
jgi:hypothetical protein